eukprot:g22372.t1
MLKNVPAKYTQRKLMRELLGAGFQGKLDFIYLPMDPRSRNARGFAFCNFSTPAAADEFCGRSGAPGASKNPSGAERKTRGVRS